ncbi:hypothetical protein ES703_63895 [subsurface metagenome]
MVGSLNTHRHLGSIAGHVLDRDVPEYRIGLPAPGFHIGAVISIDSDSFFTDILHPDVLVPKLLHNPAARRVGFEPNASVGALEFAVMRKYVANVTGHITAYHDAAVAMKTPYVPDHNILGRASHPPPVFVHT